MQTFILGLDAFDPRVFERLSEHGRLPNLTRYARSAGYARFAVANPPQSEVSWTSIATGLNPGGHGIFDFVHRDPASYRPVVSLLPTRRGLAGTHFVSPFTAPTIFDYAVRQGFPATVLWWPATFPARLGSPVRTLPGLGAPDLHGRLGVGTLFSTDAGLANPQRKTPIAPLERQGRDRYTGRLVGPGRKKGSSIRESSLELQLDRIGDQSVRLTLGEHAIELTAGMWSPILELTFKMGRFLSLPALTRVILTRVKPGVQLYVLPIQIHPLHSPWPYATPPGFVRETWKACGPFLTLGWPQDTIGLEDRCISGDQFLDLCASIAAARERILMHHLDRFREGLLACVFDCLDRIQHMFWRDRPDVVEDWYEKLDALVGRIEQRLLDRGSRGDAAQRPGAERRGSRRPSQTRIVIVSDHGFTDFDDKVHLNRWLIERGYLVTQDGHETGGLPGVDWSRSQAYAVGLNSVYLNMRGREGKGCVEPGSSESLVGRLREDLLNWRDPNGRPVVQHVWSQAEAFDGPLSTYGPDLVVGFSPGYRASAETGLGKWQSHSLEPNLDHWRGDHCVDPESVPGVLFSNQDLSHFPRPSYRDFPALTIGAAPRASDSAPPPAYGDEDETVIEDRLKSLGYL